MTFPPMTGFWICIALIFAMYAYAQAMNGAWLKVLGNLAFVGFSIYGAVVNYG